VATHFGFRTDFKKMRNLIENTEYGIEEGFVFDFEKSTWMKFSKEKGVETENPSWSNLLSYDLNKIL
jgi:hypothetical protein